MDTDIDMNNNFIQNVKDPINSDHGVNKKYVDNKFLSKNGGIVFGPISMNRNDLLGTPDEPKFGYSAVNKNYVNSEIAKIATVDTSQFIKKDGSVPMSANLDMGTNKIENVKTPTNDMDVATKSYLDNTLAKSHLVSSRKTNAFKYLDDPNDTSSEYNIVINNYSTYNNSPHQNKMAYSVTLQKDAGSNNYRSRMGFNLFPQDVGTYTLIFEFFPPEMTNIQISCQATTAYIHKQVQKDFTDYSKLLVQINNNSKDTPDYIFFTMHGTASVSPVQGYIIVYGVKDWSE